ncbi:MAG: hypothetical protein IKV88_01065 [Clostridia bacterium]|nr:hypothetical protein [Clostridia bacterium]
MKYKGKYTKEISFPLGGIGTGSIGLSGDGRLIDWEIFNRPSKGSINGFSHFAIRAIDGDRIYPAVICGDLQKEHMGQYGNMKFRGYGFGPDSRKMPGFPHFKNVEFDGSFPIAKLSFSDDKFPGEVTMTAFNPFIPHDEYNSSIPGAFFEFEISNTSDKPLIYDVAFTVANPYEKSVNRYDKEHNTLSLVNAGADKNDVAYGDITLTTDCDNTFCQEYWYRGKWRDNIVSFWNEFSSEKSIMQRTYETEGNEDLGTLYGRKEILPGEKKRIRFVLCWNVPNNYNYWTESDNEDVRKPWKNYYATVFESSVDSALYSISNFKDLLERTEKFKDTLHNSTLPIEVTDAASSNLSVLKSPTVLRLEDGSFYGWEGVHENEGSCEGTCQHVWNYAYAMCFLFPNLEMSIRNNEFMYSREPDGKMGFRMMLPLGSGTSDFRACLDGQMGAVIKCYREWKISGDNIWLEKNIKNIENVLEYAWSKHNPDMWDADKDGVLEGRQHHTLDMELFGPSSWLEGMYLLALKCAAEMESFLGNMEKSEEYYSVFEKGKKWTEENLFNSKYFIHKIDINDKSLIDKYGADDDYWNVETEEINYQIGEGSSIDQVLAQWHADILGAGKIFDDNQLSVTLENMMKNNFKESMRYFTNPWRIYSMYDEAGSVICDYPEGAEKPKIPIPYCEETMTGFEYSFAGLLCSRGKIEDGIKVVKAIRDRFDGKKRNPWNEFECGSNYARSMASYALVPILSGFEYDMPQGHIGFNPYKKGDFNCIWSVGESWGNFEICHNKAILDVFENKIKLKSFGIKFADIVSKVTVDGKEIDFEHKDGVLYFEETEILERLEINL